MQLSPQARRQRCRDKPHQRESRRGPQHLFRRLARPQPTSTARASYRASCVCKAEQPNQRLADCNNHISTPRSVPCRGCALVNCTCSRSTFAGCPVAAIAEERPVSVRALQAMADCGECSRSFGLSALRCVSPTDGWRSAVKRRVDGSVVVSRVVALRNRQSGAGMFHGSITLRPSGAMRVSVWCPRGSQACRWRLYRSSPPPRSPAPQPPAASMACLYHGLSPKRVQVNSKYCPQIMHI